MPSPALRTFADVLGLLPAGFALLRHAEALAGRPVVVHEGDVRLPELGLGPSQGDGLLVLVTGALVVDGPVWHESGDGGCALVVLGDLQAHSLLLQDGEVFVGGRLQVEQLVLGQYNHGRLVVCGPARAAMWICLEQYDLVLQGGMAGERWDDDREGLLPPALSMATLAPVFVPEVLHRPGPEADFPEDWLQLANWLDHAALLGRSRAGLPLLQGEVVPAPPARLGDGALHAANLEKLLETPLLEGRDAHGDFLLRDPFSRSACIISQGKKLQGLTLFDDTQVYELGLEYPASFWQRLSRRPAAPRLRLRLAERGEGPRRWRVPSGDEQARFQVLWQQWLPRLAEAEALLPRIRREITPARLQALLDLPCTRAGLAGIGEGMHFNGHYLVLGQAEAGKSHLVVGWRGSRELDEEGLPDFCMLHFILEADGSLDLRFQPDQGPDLTTFEASGMYPLYPAMLQCFAMAEELLQQGQASQEADARRRLASLPDVLDVPLREAREGEAPEDVPSARFAVAPQEAWARVLDQLSFAGEPASCTPWDQEGLLLVMEEDARLPCLELVSQVGEVPVAGYLFLGNLELDSHLAGYEPDYSPMLVVVGDLKARNLYLTGGEVHVAGGLQAETLYGFYNHGALTVAGTLETRLLISQDFPIRCDELRAEAIIADDSIQSFNRFAEADGTTQRRLDLFPGTCHSQDVLAPALCDPSPWWGDLYFPDHSALLQHMLAGQCVFDPQRLERAGDDLEEAEARRLFDWVFASPRLKEGLDTRSRDEACYAYAYRYQDGRQSIGLHVGHGHDYELCLSRYPDGRLQAEHYILANEARPHTVCFGEPLGSGYLSPKAGLFGFYRALERLGLLRYRSPLPAEAEPESAEQARQWLADIRRAFQEERQEMPLDAARARLLLALENSQHKLAQLLGAAAPETLGFFELYTQATRGNWSKKREHLGAAWMTLLSLEETGPLAAPGDFLEALLELDEDDEETGGKVISVWQRALALLPSLGVDVRRLEHRLSEFGAPVLEDS